VRLASRIALAVFLAATTSAAQWRLARIVPIENYPTLARQAWISGEVQVRCVLDQSGAVAEVTPVSGHPLLAIAAVENAKQWRFQPVGTGTPEKSEITLTYVFRFTEPGTRENPKATFNLDGPNHIAVTAPLACSDNSPCTLPKPATQQSDDALSGPFKLSKQDAIQNGDYRLEKAYDEIEQGWTARLSRDGKLLGVFSIGGEGAFEKHHIRLGFFPLFKNENREQLIVRIWSGGAHCCDTYWIADLLPEFRILYRSATI
jgi:TonB family protein